MQQPALAHLGTQRDNTLWLFHQLAERAGRVEAVLAHGVVAGAADAVQPAQERIRAACDQLVAAVQVDVQLVVGHAVLYKAHQTGQDTGYASWFDALAAMEREMDAADYDVAIVGAGAYGLPLAAHARDTGHAPSK